MKTAIIIRTALIIPVVLGLCGYSFAGQTVYAEDSNDTYIVVDDMEDYNDRDDIRAVWTDGYADGSSGSNLNVSTAVGSPFNGATGPVHGGAQAMVLRYDNDGMTYSGLPGEEKPLYPVPYFSEIEASTVGDNSLNIGQNWAATGFTELSLWFQGHPISDGDYDANGWPSFTLYGRGRDIGGRHDEFYFLSQYPLTTPGTIQVQVYDMEDTDPWAKAGLMIREKWTPYSRYAAVFMTPGNGVTFQYRDVEDGPTTTITKPGVTTPQYVKLERTLSDNFIAYHSSNGFVWDDVNAPGQAPVYPEIAMGEMNLYVGTAVTSHNANQICSADFNNMAISPMPPNWIFGNIGTNDPEQLYVALEDTVGNVGVVEHDDAGAATLTGWQEWKIPLTSFTGVDFSSIKKVYIGLGDRDNPVPGGSGAVYIDEIYLSGIPVGETYHVDGVNGDDTNDGLTPETAFATIQKGIDTAADGDTVIVYPDSYSENINFLGKNITVTSTNPDDPACIASTIIQGTGAGPVVTFSGSEGQNCVLDGLTITDGNTMGDGGGICGNGTVATIANCVIANNHADGVGGGVSNCSGRIVGCTITGNTAGGDGLDGGGGIYVFDCNVSVEDCDINNNAAAGHGGGLCFYASPGSTITRCAISDNDAIRSGKADGGGIFVLGEPPILIEDCRISRNSASRGGGGVCVAGAAGPVPGLIQVRQCLITDNTACEGGGGISCKWYVKPRISNCTIADNQVTGAAGVGYGGGLDCSYTSNVEVINSIIWGNFAEQGFQVAVRWGPPPGMPSTLALSHSDVEGGSGGAYVEAGSTLDWGIGAIDSDPQLVDPNGGDWHLGAGSPCIDMGDNSAVPPSLLDLDGNPRIVNGTVDMGAYEFQGSFKRYYHVDGVNGDNTNNGLTKETAFKTIQRGINVADDLDTVLVWPGVYNEEISFWGDAITVKSAADAAIVETDYGYAFSFFSAEGTDTVLSNFIIRNSQYGIYLINGASPTLRNLTIVDNDFGISAFNGADPDISSCIFWNNYYGDLFRDPVPLEAKYSWVQDEVNEPYMPPSGLISYWKFNEGSGSVAYDSAGTNDGAVYGAQWITGQIGGALSFDGMDDRVDIPDSDVFDFANGDFSISAWFNTTDVSIHPAPFIINFKQKDNDPHIEIYVISENGKIGTHVSPEHDRIEYSGNVNDGTWHHVVITMDNGVTNGYKLYLDSIMRGQRTFSSTLSDWDTITIGHVQPSGAYNSFDGAIDEIMVYDRALSSGEVEAIYDVGSAGLGYGGPGFVDAAGGDYHLLSERGRYWPAHSVWVLDDATSVCIDGGDPAVDPSNERMPNGGRINMGAYGNSAYASMSECWSKSDFNCDGVVDFKDFAIMAASWLDKAAWIE